MLKRISIALIVAIALSGSFAVLPVFAQDDRNMQDGMMSDSKMKDDKMKPHQMKDDKMSKHRKKAKHRRSRKPKPAEKMSGDKM